MTIHVRRSLIVLSIILGALGAGLLGSASSGLAQAAPSVQVAQNATFGAILTTPDGKTLYTFSPDSGGKSACTGPCVGAWPPATIAGTTPAAPAGVTAASLGTIVRDDGSHQLTFNGRPLYNFVRDTAAGQVNGDGVNAFNGTWSVARVAAAAAAPAGSTVARAMPATGTGGLGGGASDAAVRIALVAVVALALAGIAVRLARVSAR